MVGRTISHYRIQSKLGEGGIGVVYKADDTKLERSVALKFLATHVASDEAVRKRFEREAKAVAALDHPNICTVFEIDEAEGMIFLAMAFVEGPTVKERIAQRPLKLDEALEIAVQTAEGLRAAHSKGIVHRDIKPGNVMLNAQSQVKILDFGLARLIDATLTQGASIVGTPAYMSPEQARGQPTDHRTDIWSLGVMLYEIITGSLPFAGERTEAILHAITTSEPEPVTAMRAGVPMELEWIIGKCMNKNPDRRYQHIEELVVDLSTVRKKLNAGAFKLTGSANRSGDSTQQRTIRRAALSAGIGAVAVTLAVIGARALRHSPEETALRTVKFTITPIQLLRGGDNNIDAEVSISGDGKHIAYVESRGRQLWVRDIDQEQARPVPGATEVYQVFWSHDNLSLGYSAGGCYAIRGGCDLVRIPIQGGTPVTITKLDGGFRRASYSSDGETIVYCDSTGLFTVPARGGSPTRIIEHPHIEHPSFLDLPRGRRAYLYQAMDRERPGHAIYVQVVGESQRRFVTLSSSSNPYPAYSPSGHIVYVDGNNESSTIVALPFSLSTLQTSGKAFPIAQRGSSPMVSRTGSLVYSDVPSNRTQLAWVGRSGTTISTVGEPQRQGNLRLSPDGRRLAVEVREGDADLWVYDLDRGIKTRFTSDSAAESLGAWTPAGDRLTYAYFRRGNADLLSKPSSGNGDATLLVGTPLREVDPDWSSDYRFLIYVAVSSETRGDLLYRERHKEGTLGESAIFMKTSANEGTARFSPDGKYVAYMSDESGRNEVFVSDFPKGVNRWQISANGGSAPRWRRDGKEIFYSEGHKLMAVPVEIRSGFSPGKPGQLFEKRDVQSLQYDVAPDAKRFVILERPAGEPPLSVHVAHNWFEEFRGRQRKKTQ
jgi:Tol biopolymer transport system component